jgi:thiamine-phosphate pyrophosphorylase
MTTPEHRCRLYLISPAKIDVGAFARDLEAAFAAGDVACFQLRLKGAGDEDIFKASEVLLPVCRKYDVPFLLNDNAGLARDVGADGVHLGQDDGALEDARTKLGFDAMIGVTCHDSRHLAFLAGDAGADYVAFGAFFPTKTKKTKFTAKPDLLTWWAEIAEIPCLAIGGITPANCAPLIEAGAHFLAVSSAVWNHPGGPAEAVKSFNACMKKHSPR